MMDGVHVTIVMTGLQAIALLLTPIVALGFCLLTAWADEQRFIEEWWERRCTR
jgi:hypothetical protein